jgi:DNA-binding MarR family transcriptional regulator
MQMAKQAEQRRMMGALLSRSFTIQQPELSVTESIALECLKQIASEGREATQDEVRSSVGGEGAGTATGIINRLVAKGYVEHVTGNPLQRAIWVRIVATGQATAEPKCKIVHWRYRKEKVPAPAIHQIRERSKSLASMIEAKAKLLNKPVHEFLMDCVYVGFHQIEGEAQ